MSKWDANINAPLPTKAHKNSLGTTQSRANVLAGQWLLSMSMSRLDAGGQRYLCAALRHLKIASSVHIARPLSNLVLYLYIYIHSCIYIHSPSPNFKVVKPVPFMQGMNLYFYINGKSRHCPHLVQSFPPYTYIHLSHRAKSKCRRCLTFSVWA